MNMSRFFMGLITLTIFISFVTPVTALTLVVNQSGPACTTGTNYYTTISLALTNSNNSDTIFVCQGTFNENLDITTSVNLTGFPRNASKVFINASNTADDVIDITTENVSVSFFTIKNSVVRGLYVLNSDRVNISYNIINEVGGSSGNTIYFDTSDYGIFSHNIITHKPGVIGTDVNMKRPDFLTITNNIFYGVAGPGKTQVFAWSFTPLNTTISNNTFTLTNYTSVIEIPGDNNIKGVNVYNNLFNVTNSSFVNVLGSPEFLFNTSLTNVTNIINGNISGGNFWCNQEGTGFSDTCIDANRNGICDTSYIINSSVPYIDYYPLTVIKPLPIPPSNIRNAFGNFTDILRSTTSVFGPLFILFVWVGVISLIGLAVVFVKRIFNILSDKIDMRE